MWGGTYDSCDDGDIVDRPRGFLLEELLDDEVADLAGTDDGEPSEVGHDVIRVGRWTRVLSTGHSRSECGWCAVFIRGAMG
jgi:hypothetical protein